MSEQNHRLKESLSALMDDKADELEIQRVLKAAAEDDELRGTWERYQIARSAMHGDAPVRTMDLSASIAAALDDEPAHKSRSGALKNLGRMAIAASVTLAIVVGVQQSQQLAGNESISTPQLADSNPVNVPMPSEFSASIPTAPVGYGDLGELVVEPPAELDDAAKRQLEARFNELLKSHTDDASLNKGQSLLPHARLPEKSSKGQPKGQ